MARRHSKTPARNLKPKQPTPSAWPRLMRPALAALYLSAGKSALDEWRRLGLIPPVVLPSVRHEGRASRSIWFDKSDLDAFVDKQKLNGGVL